jgi:hypothetical protein
MITLTYWCFHIVFVIGLVVLFLAKRIPSLATYIEDVKMSTLSPEFLQYDDFFTESIDSSEEVL